MKLALNIIGISLSIIGVIIYFFLYRYIKRHSDEELEAHESYILSRLVIMVVLEACGGIVNIIAILL